MKNIQLMIIGIITGISIICSTASAGTYSTVVQVNDSAVTQFEVDQRIRMLRAFRAPGDLQSQAIEQLIGDRLRMQAAKDAGISISEDEVFGGMEEFAARGNFSADQLLNFLRQQGVYRETFEDFVRAGLVWRDIVRAKFASKVNISDEEIDARLDVQSVNFPKTANIAEIILPIEERGAGPTRALADRLSESTTSDLLFSQAARKFSKSETAARGGLIGWIPVGSLPPQVATMISALEVGQVTAPITLGNSIGLYQLRGIREAKSASEQVISVSYLQVAIPGNKAGRDGQIKAASKLINAGDTCLDMQANASGFGEGAVVSQSLPAAQVPPRIGAEIAKLDPNEASYFVADNGNINVVMLCNRAKDLPEGARDQIRSALFGQRVGSFGDGYLQELRGDAIIVRK